MLFRSIALVPVLQEQQCSQSEPAYKIMHQQQDLPKEHVQQQEGRGYLPDNVPEWIIQAEFHFHPDT